MTLLEIKKIARYIAKTTQGVVRCSLVERTGMELTATWLKSFISIYNLDTNKPIEVPYSRLLDKQEFTARFWKIKPRGAGREEWIGINIETIIPNVQKFLQTH